MGEEEERRHADREVGNVGVAGPHLAAPVRDAHRPAPPPSPVELELRREREPARLLGTEVLRHPAHHRVDVLRPDAPRATPAAYRRRLPGAVDRRSPLAGRDVEPLACRGRVDHELRVLDGAGVRERLQRLVEVAAADVALAVEGGLDLAGQVATQLKQRYSTLNAIACQSAAISLSAQRFRNRFGFASARSCTRSRKPGIESR
jgi:hypothetical protein